MAKRELVFRFHNPNTAEETADLLIKIFIQVHLRRFKQAMLESCADKRAEADNDIHTENA